jgi:hypothetical protein
MNKERKEEIDKEDFSILYKIFIILLWWKEIQNGDWELKKKGFRQKYKSRITYIIIGMIFYTLIILYVCLKD